MSLENRLVAAFQSIGTDIKTITQSLTDLAISSTTYTHTQAVPSASWVILHNLGKYPSVTVVDSAGTIVEGDVVYDSSNQLTVSFVGGFSGKAYLN